MSAFLFVFRKKVVKEWSKAEINAYLPRPCEDMNVYVRGRSLLYHLEFNTALFRNVLHNSHLTMAVEGYISKENHARLPDLVLNDFSFDVSSFPDAFCSIVFKEESFGFYSSLTAVDQLFFYEDDTGFYATNRHNLLGLVQKDFSLRKDSFAWICSRGHIGDHGSYWNEIKRSKPGVKYYYNGTLKEITGGKQGLVEEIDDADSVEYLKSVADEFSLIFNKIDSEKSLSLTGGKDSRAILGLLDYSNSLKKIRVNTTGALYSPDVMSAKCLTKKLGISNHVITRPKLINTSSDYAERIANDLLFDFLGKTIADMSKFSFTERLVFGGHEVGIKSEKNKKGLQEYIRSRKNWCDDQLVLNSEVRRNISKDYNKSLLKSLSNIPISCYDKIEGIDHRVSNRNSPNITGSHLGSSQVHPFYDGRIIKAVCGFSDKLLQSQFIPYFFTNLSRVDLVNEPFANDGWPSTLSDILDEYENEYSYRKVKNTPAFKFLSEFPSEKSFGMFSWRLDLCDLTQKKIVEYITDNKGFFNFLDFKKSFLIINKPSKEKSFREMQVHLGILKAVLLHHLKDSIFSFENKEAIVREIRYFLGNGIDKKTNVIDLQKKLEEKIVQYENAISELATRIIRVDPNENLSYSKHDIRRDKGFSEKKVTLESKPISLGKFSFLDKVYLSGKLKKKLNKRQLLIFFKSEEKYQFPDFNYSEKLEGYFKYLSIEGYDCRVDWVCPVLNEEGIDSLEFYLSTWNMDRLNFLLDIDLKLNLE